MDVFEQRTGKFIPLDADQLATLSPEQADAYADLARAVSLLDAAKELAASARAFNQEAVRQLDYARANAPPPPSHTDLAREAMRQWREDHPR